MKVRSKISLFLAMVMLVGLLPMTAFAANDELVLTSINHPAAVSPVNISATNSVAFTVPNNYTGTVDLSNGLDLSYNTALYTTVSGRFPSGPIATVGGSPISMVVTYQKVNDATLYTTNYNIIVIKASYNAPTFTGTIAKSVTLPNSLTLTAADFTSLYTKYDGAALASVVITGNNPAFGALKLNNQAYAAGTAIPLADLESGKLTFAATGEGTVSYSVKAYAAGDTQTSIGSVVLTITVLRSANGGAVTYNTNKNTLLKLSSADFTNAFSTAAGEALSTVKFTLPAVASGRFYYNYRSATDYDAILFADTAYAASAISNITFVPATGFTGTVTIPYTAYSASGAGLLGSLVINVTNPIANVADITLSTNKNIPVALGSATFTGAYTTATGGTLANVKFALPSEASGKLFYNYRSAADYDAIIFADTAYPASSISNISFVPAKDFTGTAAINYTAANASGATLPGKLVINVGSTSTGTNVITYTTGIDKPLSFNATDFNNISKSITGKDLSYVKFPSTVTSGKLYYNYVSPTVYDSIVYSDIGYIKNSNPYLSNVDFVPATGFTGTVTIGYTGYNTDGTSFTGDIKIIVGTATVENGDHFKDVNKNYAWALEAINYLYQNKIILGDKNGFYNPNASVSRGDFILMLCRAFDLKADRSGNFSDVEEGSYYYDAIATAKSLKIVKGDGGKFNPRSALSRQDAMVLIDRAMEAAGITIDSSDGSDLQVFSDSNKIDDYAKKSVSCFVKSKIIKGNDKKISPKSSISRAEIAVILHRILTK